MRDEAHKIENVIRAQRTGVELEATDLFAAQWDSARPAHLSRYWSGEDAPPERHAEARMLWSDQALLVRFVCQQREPLVVSPTPQTIEKTIGLWERDVCEIFVAPNASEPERYFEFEAAPTGEWVDLMLRTTPKGRETDWRFRSGMTAAARVDDGSVSICMRVPYEAFKQRPQSNARWRVNLFRCVGRGAERGYLAWQPTRTPQPNFHVPEAFGWVHFL